MADSATDQAHAASPADADHEGAYVYPTSGIAEGHARVPRWLAAVIFALLGFWGWYIATQWNAQTTSAQMKK
jgi:hypothetical protein